LGDERWRGGVEERYCYRRLTQLGRDDDSLLNQQKTNKSDTAAESRCNCLMKQLFFVIIICVTVWYRIAFYIL
jgi:hypothetical protein